MRQAFYGTLASLMILTGCATGNLNFYSEDEAVKPAPANISFRPESLNWEEFHWDFGDGTTSTDTFPKHTYFLSGTYTVTLTRKKGKRTKEVKKEIHVGPPEVCLINIETDYGDMLAVLYDETPYHKDNFTKLVEEGFYDNLLFHRVIQGFMIQGGDPDSKNANSSEFLGKGSPGYRIKAEIDSRFAHVKGAIAAARLNDQVNPDKLSSGSQFYIVQGKRLTNDELDNFETRLSSGYQSQEYSENVRQQYLTEGGVPFLDGEYTVFGQVIQGLDVIDKIAAVATREVDDRPLTDVRMKISLIK